MSTKNNDKKCIVISFSTKKTRPLTSVPSNNNLVVQSLRRRTMSSINLEKNNPTYPKQLQQYIAVNEKKSLKNSFVQQKKPIMMGENIERQKLYQENLQLKKQINKLKDETTLLKSKLEVPAKPISSELQMKFSKELYWTGNNSYMVSGVKAQYQKLKSKNKMMEEECKMLKVKLYETKKPQKDIYIRELEDQNFRLKKKIGFEGLPSSIKQTSEVELFGKKILELEGNLKAAKESIQQKNERISFLQSRMIELSNNQHKSGVTAKKEQKKRKQSEDQCKKLKQLLKNSEQGSEVKIHYLQQQLENYHLNQANYSQLAQREIKLQMKKYTEKIKILEEQICQIRLERDILKEQVCVLQEKQASNLLHQKIRKNTMHSHQSDMLRQTILKLEKESEEKMSEVNFDEIHSTRKRRMANQRHSEESVRKRRVKFFEIEQLAKILSLRMINAKIDSEEVKDFFDEKNQFSEEEKQYITMREVLDILKKQPFSLKEDSAEMIARYLVEDCEEEYVYMDLNNENYRLMVKSIIKSLLGSYTLLPQQTYKQLEEMLEINKKFLGKAIKDMVKGSMTVHQKKLFEAMKNLQIKVSQACRQAILAKLSVHSESLSELRYMYLFG